jgi:hypothetical protein
MKKKGIKVSIRSRFRRPSYNKAIKIKINQRIKTHNNTPLSLLHTHTQNAFVNVT